MPGFIEFPNNMAEFCKLLERDPILVYMEMARLSQEEANEETVGIAVSAIGTVNIPKAPDFPFPPYQSVLKDLIRSIETDPLFKDTDLDSIHDELEDLLVQNCPYGKTTHSIEKAIRAMEGGGIRREVPFLTEYTFPPQNVTFPDKNIIDFWTYREHAEGSGMSFAFACNAELNLPFFVNTRATHLFPIGVTTKEVGFDDTSTDTIGNFWLHDIAHMTNIYKKDYPKAENDTIADYALRPNLSMIDRHLFTHYLQSLINTLENQDLKNATWLILFEFFHEIGRGDLSDTEQINEKIMQRVTERQQGGFLYPPEYKTAGVLNALPYAAQLIRDAINAYEEPELDDAIRSGFLEPDINQKDELISTLRTLEEASKTQAQEFIENNPRYKAKENACATKSDFSSNNITLMSITPTEVMIIIENKTVAIGRASELMTDLLTNQSPGLRQDLFVKSETDQKLMDVLLTTGLNNPNLMNDLLMAGKENKDLIRPLINGIVLYYNTKKPNEQEQLMLKKSIFQLAGNNPKDFFKNHYQRVKSMLNKDPQIHDLQLQLKSGERLALADLGEALSQQWNPSEKNSSINLECLTTPLECRAFYEYYLKEKKQNPSQTTENRWGCTDDVLIKALKLRVFAIALESSEGPKKHFTQHHVLIKPILEHVRLIPAFWRGAWSGSSAVEEKVMAGKIQEKDFKNYVAEEKSKYHL